MPDSFSLDRAAEWLLYSGIQESSGGAARFYRSDVQRNDPVSTEITGYHLSVLIYLHRLTGNAAYLDRALLTGRFLTRCAWDCADRTFPFEYPGAGKPAYFFDCGIINRGLLSLWRATQDREFLDAAAACANSMLADFDSGEDFHPILQLPGKQPQQRDARWSRTPGCYQLKSAWSWYELAEITGDTAFRNAYDRVLASALASHRDFLPGHADADRVMDRLHAYCYFLEGLLPCARTSPYRAAFSEGIDRVSHFLHKIAPSFARSDVYAQLLRLRLFEIVPLDLQLAEFEAEKLAEFQACDSDPRDPRIDGGFYFGRKGPAVLPYVNPVSTAFGLQALHMWRERLAGTLAPCRQTLI
ncbi:MAG: hypothetical protein M3Z85_14720 [Acidobacteriota bacterium]|nr:hypothetical protein [Acidobacteriota bacterium]